MPISRGSIKHTLTEDLANLIRVYTSGRPTARATEDIKRRLKTEIRQRFNAENVELFPYARTAFHATLVSLNLPEGSKVLMTPITIGPMLEIVLNLGYEPIFVDIELATFGPEINDLKEKLKQDPGCFLLTYLFGYVPDIERIASLCKSAKCTLIEDISHNIGAKFDGKPLGTFGTVGIYSASLLKYVDGYNGAFLLTTSAELAERIHDQVLQLKDPNRRRIRGTVNKTFIWNLALSRHFFSFVTYPVLRLLKSFSPSAFEKLLGPSIKLGMHKTLPAFWFEDIAQIQCETILRHLEELDALLQSRRESAGRALQAMNGPGQSVPATSLAIIQNGSIVNTFWQFVVAVPDVAKAREILFLKGVETGTTNLLDVARAAGINLANANALKEKHIFIPLHRHLKAQQYKAVVECLMLDQ